MASADAMVGVFEGWVAQGIHEQPAHSNNTSIGAEYGWNGVAWCCISASVAQKHIGMHCFWRADVAGAINLAKNGTNGMVWVPKGQPCARGDFSTFDWRGNSNPNDFHISLVKDPSIQSKFLTIGGNENDSVFQQWRDTTFVQGFIRLPYDQAAPPPAPPAPPAHHHDMPMVKFAAGGPDAKVHGAVRRPNGTWVWQTTYSQVFWEVKDIQQHMHDQGYPIVVDGVGGPDTLRQVKQYQAARGLASDGVVGPNTWVRLHG